MRFAHDPLDLTYDIGMFRGHIMIFMRINFQIIEFGFYMRIPQYADFDSFPFTHSYGDFTTLFMKFPIEIWMFLL